MKISKHFYYIQEFKFAILWLKNLDHRRELVITLPYREFVLGFDW